MLPLQLLLRLSLLAATATISSSSSSSAWSGPLVRPVFSRGGISALSIDGSVSAASWLVGNTQGGLNDDFASWAVELAGAARAGVRIFGICPDGSDLLGGPEAVLSNHTRAMVGRVLDAVPDALVIPRVPIGTFLGAGSAFEHAELVASASSLPGKPAGTVIPSSYGSLTAAWANVAMGDKVVKRRSPLNVLK